MINFAKIKNQIPEKPGCYIYKDHNHKVLYVGKAINLKNRIASYFSKTQELQSKIIKMLEIAEFVEYVTVDSEVEALILENNLIKKYRPKYNKMMKDDKSYVWVAFDMKKDFPKPEIVRERKSKTAKYFGPYPKTFPARKVLSQLRKIFPYCNTNFKIKQNKNNKSIIGAEKRPCLDYHIGLCSGVCAGKVSRLDHRKNILNIKRFFEGKKQEIYKDLDKRMKAASKAHDFELAGELRDQIRNIEYVTQNIKISSQADEKNLKAFRHSYHIKSINDLFSRLKIPLLQKRIENGNNNIRIECYDISNFQGTNATGSMVVFVEGKALKEHYRKFKIKTKSTPDDFAMMGEVLTRRFKHSGTKTKKDPSFDAMPDLVIVDGGKGQLSSAYEVLQNLNLLEQFALVGLAKREEEIFRIEIENGEKAFKKTTLPKQSPAMYLVQRVRDEAHRFAIGYHRTLRSNNAYKSILDDVPGVGEVIRKRLIKAFGSLGNIQKASRKDLQNVVKNKATVEKIMKLR